MEDVFKLIIFAISGFISLVITFLFYRWIFRFTLKHADRKPLTVSHLFWLGLGLSLLFIICMTVLTFVMLILNFGSGGDFKNSGNALLFMSLSGVTAIWLALIYRRYWAERINEMISNYFKRKSKRDEDDPRFW